MAYYIYNNTTGELIGISDFPMDTPEDCTSTIDGENKQIIINHGVSEIDIRIDLYSDWKEWMQLRDNAKYPLAFRTTGG